MCVFEGGARSSFFQCKSYQRSVSTAHKATSDQSAPRYSRPTSPQLEFITLPTENWSDKPHHVNTFFPSLISQDMSTSMTCSGWDISCPHQFLPGMKVWEAWDFIFFPFKLIADHSSESRDIITDLIGHSSFLRVHVWYIIQVSLLRDLITIIPPFFLSLYSSQ